VRVLHLRPHQIDSSDGVVPFYIKRGPESPILKRIPVK
jgi:hypothetical protein